MNEGHIDPKIVRLATKDSFLEVFDELGANDRTTGEPTFNPKYRMLKFSVLNYKKKVGDKSAYVWFSMHERDFLYVRHLLLTRRLRTKGEGAHFTSFKGTKSTKYDTGYQSRTIEIERQLASVPPSRPDAGNQTKVLLTISNGPGIAGKTGQVMPAKSGEHLKLLFTMDEAVAVSMVEEIYVYLQGWHARNALSIVAAHAAWADWKSNGNEDANDGAVIAEVELEPDVETQAIEAPAGTW